jgi:hypothetical protein
VRDDFSQKAKDLLAKRVAYNCSNPGCKMATIGPNSLPDKATNIGVAAHVTAASVGGPRYDVNLTEEQRTSIENGIWLCQSCSKLVDSDLGIYTTVLLKQWKQVAEGKAAEQLNKQMSLGGIPFAGANGFEEIPQNGFFEKEFHSQKLRFFLQGSLLHVEQELPDGVIAYYVLDPNGNLIDQKFPYDISEYTIEFDPSLVLKTFKEPLNDGFTKETVSMKWGKTAIMVRDSKNRLTDIRIEKGSTVDHISKKIIVSAPDFKRA